MRGEVKLTPNGTSSHLPLETGLWRFVQAPSPGKLVPGAALAHALRVEMMKSGSIATFGWSQWLTIKPAEGLTEDLALALAAPLDVTQGFPTPFAEAQPNIIRAHARDRLDVFLLDFGDSADRARVVLADFARDMKTASAHNGEVMAFKRKEPRNEPVIPYIGIGLSSSGYEKLDATPPADEAFRQGMRQRRDVLGDPDDTALQEGYRTRADAIVIVGWPRGSGSDAAVDAIRTRLEACATVVAHERGATKRNDAGEAIEHFGFADGLSGPKFIIDGSDTGADGPWNSLARLGSVVVKEPEGPGFGSYLVYRKLQQDPDAFDRSTTAVATHLWQGAKDASHAGALLFGRHPDGTPTVEHREPAGDPTNAFDYTEDLAGLRCPVGAHIRRMEERNGRTPVLARRGQTYGPDEHGEVGVLFMAVMSSIEGQFEAVQKRANDPASFDALIGQGNSGDRPRSRLAVEWGEGATQEVDTEPAVHLRGGEYFFLPSVTFLQELSS